MALSTEAREKISQSAKGRAPWNKGKELPLEVRQKISETTINKHLTNKSIDQLLLIEHVLLNQIMDTRGEIVSKFTHKQKLEAEGRAEMIDHIKNVTKCDAVGVAEEMGFLPVTSAAIRQKRYRERKKGVVKYPHGRHLSGPTNI